MLLGLHSVLSALQLRYVLYGTQLPVQCLISIYDTVFHGLVNDCFEHIGWSWYTGLVLFNLCSVHNVLCVF